MHVIGRERSELGATWGVPVLVGRDGLTMVCLLGLVGFQSSFESCYKVSCDCVSALVL